VQYLRGIIHAVYYFAVVTCCTVNLIQYYSDDVLICYQCSGLSDKARVTEIWSCALLRATRAIRVG
jgi:hypothetical protein